MAEIFGISVTGGSSGEGATLTVIAPQNTQSITIKKGEKTYTKQGTTAEFKNLEAGTWEITSLSTTGQVSGKKEVTIVLQYSSQTAYFAANIQVTYPAGSTCTCSKGEIVLNAPDTTGSHIFVVPEAGEWIVSSTDGELTDSESVIISSDGESKSITLEYFTATIVTTFPTDCTSVTCTKGDTVLSVPSGSLASGEHTFSVHETGEWVLYATNGDKEKTVTVTVTDETEYSVKLNFELVLYSPTKDWQSNVVGYSSNDQVSISEENTELKMIFKQNPYGDNAVYEAYAYSDGPVDLTEYNTAQISLRVIWGSEYINNLTIGFATTQTGKFTVSKNLGSYSGTNLDDTYSLDISNLNGEYYFCMRASNGLGGLGTLYISEAIAK